MFGRHPRLPSDNRQLRPLTYDGEMLQASLDRIEKMQHARMNANKKLVDKAIKAKQVRNQLVKEVGFREDQWVLVRAESRNKFEGRWFGPYRIAKKMILGTYLLADPEGNVVANLINGQRLVTANIPDGKVVSKLWNSSKIQGALRRRKIDLTSPSPEVTELFAQENADTPNYDELASIPAKEWMKMMENRKGDGSSQVGKGNRDPAEPTVEDLDALQAGIREGLREGPAVGDVSQDTAAAVEVDGPQTVVDLADRPQTVVVPRREELSPWKADAMDLQEGITPRDSLMEMDSDQEMLDTTMNDPILEPNAESEPDQGTMEVDPTEEIVEPHTAPKATRVPSWKRELTASTQERERVDSPYGLRQRPSKRITQD
jgi:hypothetical protein